MYYNDFLIESFVLEKQIFCKKAAGEINKESAGSSEPFFAFHQEGKKQIKTIGQYNDTRSDKNLPFPMLVSELSNQSNNPVRTKRSEIKEGNSDSMNLKPSRPFSLDGNQEKIVTINQARPLSPSIKNIADQTAKAAFIRTLITERLNSCSPLG